VTFGLCLCGAFIIAIRGTMGSPPFLPTTSATLSRLPNAQPALDFWQFHDVFRRVAQRHQRFPARQFDRIEKPLIPLEEVR
jgi:hypothetical protein